MKRRFSALVALSVFLAGCTSHEVDLKPIKVEPVHVTVDINVTLQKEFEQLFLAAQTPPLSPADQTRAKVEAEAARMKKRTPKVIALKDAAKIGETSQGLLEALKPTDDKQLLQFLDGVNDDQEVLFQLIARENNTSVDTVRRNFVLFCFQNSPDHHYFKDRNGTWLTKKEWIQRGYSAPFPD